MENNNEFIFGFATSMAERIQVLANEKENLCKDTTYLECWRKRRSLLSDEDFEKMLHIRGLSVYHYNLGVKPLNSLSLKKLFLYVKKQNWYILHKSLFEKEIDIQPKDLNYAVRFHVNKYINYIEEILEKNREVLILEKCVVQIGKNLEDILLSIASRTLVWDVHEQKELLNLATLDDDFTFYLNKRFGNAERTEGFFREYPTLARLLSEKLDGYCKNFKMLIDSMVKNSKELEAVFNISPPFYITQWDGNQGDSHNGGKSAIILEINGVKLVYKYHNNNLLLQFNKFIAYINTYLVNDKLYTYDCVSGENYCFEKYISNTGCKDLSEIEIYYKRYGYLVALTYWLNSTDLHMENIIAKGSDPVIIDAETLLQAEERRVYSDDSTSLKYFENNSVITTGLLPMNKHWKRQIDISGLNGIKQKLPFKVRKLINKRSTDIEYSYQDKYVDIGNNVPCLHRKFISYNGFEDCIIEGFNAMMSILMKNMNNILTTALKLFSNVQVRCVLRDTEDYQNFLEFSTHPSCMIDYIEREKIFENLWSNSFINKKIVNLEIDALLVHDIPYFYTYASAVDIYTNTHCLKNYYKVCVLDFLKQHIYKITSRRLQFERILLKDSLNQLAGEYGIVDIDSNKKIEDRYLHKVIDIADFIIRSVEIDSEHGIVSWAEIRPLSASVSTLEYPNNDLYNGTTGLYIFFSILDTFWHDTRYIYICNLIEKMIFHQKYKTKYISAFYGLGAQLAAAFTVYCLKKDRKNYKFIWKSLNDLKHIIHKESLELTWDWIYGKSSLIALLSTVYEELKIPLAKEILITLTSDLNIPQHDMGFAHGYSGIVYALIRVNSILHKHEITNTIEELLDRGSKMKVEIIDDSWCKGNLGINEMLESIGKQQYCSYTFNNFKSNNSCICHGLYGKISIILKEYVNGRITKEEKELEVSKIINQPIVLYQSNGLFPLGLFNGLAGIGMQILRILEPKKILDLLYFRLLK